MARTAARPQPDEQLTLDAATRQCPACQGTLRFDYFNHRTVRTLDQLVRLNLKVRRCHNPACACFLRPYRPEEEGRWALPQHEFALEVIALAGALRYAQHRSVPEIHQALCQRGLSISPRTVTNLLDRYDELVSLSLARNPALRQTLHNQGRVILAIDGLQPDVGHEVLWVIRDCLSGQVLLARSLLSSAQEDLSRLLDQVRQDLPVPVAAVVSDGQRSIRNAVAKSLPAAPHQLCHFHYLREAALPIYEADRHAKKELKKRVRGVRPIERQVEGRDDPQAQVIQGYCAAVRSALGDDGRPPLAASGLQLHERLSAIDASLRRLAKKGICPAS